jgi:glyoxylase-like metal-dependent hydrolase (beta-lactamase superfamily II)
MTGPGTNTYILGERQLAVIDPGPMDNAHLERLCALGDIAWVLVTHTHKDHSPAAQALAARTGATLMGMPGPADGHQDVSMQPHHRLVDGETLTTPEFSLTAVHTPGHVDNHFCFLHQASGLLFTGDHVMQGATVVIIPPSGDMQAYIRSLEHIIALPVTALAPGHGHLLDAPKSYLSALIQHRLAREQKIIVALRQLPQSGLMDQLTQLAYRDVDASLHAWAIYSLWAHLIKLQAEGRATLLAGGDLPLAEWRWAPVDERRENCDDSL